jgi:DNA-binding beta-propeller fold protein YncE
MPRRFWHMALAVTLSALVAGCSQAQIGTTPAASAPKPSAASHLAPHWSRVSLGTFADPYAVAVDPRCTAHCTVYVADPGSKKIWKILPDGEKHSIGDFSSAGLSFDPQGVAFDLEAGLYIADKGGRIWTIDLRNDVTSIVDNRNPCNGCPGWWRGVGVSSNINGRGRDTLWLAWARHGLFGKPGTLYFRNPGAEITQAFSPPANFDPYGVAGDGNRNAFVADAGGKKIWLLVPGPDKIYYYDFSNGMHFVDPYGIAVTWDGQRCYVADAGAKKVYEKSPTGSWSEVGTFADPYGVAVDGAGTVYVADPGSKNVWKLTR